jgi:hypothetical protein
MQFVGTLAVSVVRGNFNINMHIYAHCCRVLCIYVGVLMCVAVVETLRFTSALAWKNKRKISVFQSKTSIFEVYWWYIHWYYIADAGNTPVFPQYTVTNICGINILVNVQVNKTAEAMERLGYIWVQPTQLRGHEYRCFARIHYMHSKLA